MPNWKKVIVSGSDAVLSSVTATAGLTVTGSARITGSLGVTGSFNQASASLASGLFAHVQGFRVTGSGIYSHAEGSNTKAFGDYSHAEGANTSTSGLASHAEGSGSAAVGNYSHAEGRQTQANNLYSHAEGEITYALAQASHAEGYNTTVNGTYSHAEGVYTTITATGQGSHVEGFYTVASGSYSHAEGANTTVKGIYSHAEGGSTTAVGSWSHAEGYNTTATGDSSHAEGNSTVALGSYQHVQGQYNLSSSAESAFIHGNGTADGSRSNLIFAVGSEVQITGSLKVSGSGTFTNIGPAVFSGSVTSTTGFVKSGAGSQYLLADGNTTSGTGGSPFPFTGTAQITGSLNVTAGITGSLQGTASFALAVAGGGGGATSPGGSTTQIQYNNAGAFGGVPNLTWNGTTLNATGSFSGYFIPRHVFGSLSVAGADYTISNPGIYCFTATDEYMNYTINFPNPNSMPAGQTITIINRDTYDANYGGSYPPVMVNGDPSIAAAGMALTYVNIDSQWILVSNTK